MQSDRARSIGTRVGPLKINAKWSPKSMKKRVSKTNVKKTTKNVSRSFFSPVLAPKLAPGGGRSSPFFDLFLSLGPFWAPLGSKWCQGPHYDTILLPFWVRFDAKIQKNVTSSGKQSQTSIQKLRSVFENLRAFCLVFHYIWVDFVCRVQPTREWKLRGA